MYKFSQSECQGAMNFISMAFLPLQDYGRQRRRRRLNNSSSPVMDLQEENSDEKKGHPANGDDVVDLDELPEYRDCRGGAPDQRQQHFGRADVDSSATTMMMMPPEESSWSTHGQGKMGGGEGKGRAEREKGTCVERETATWTDGWINSLAQYTKYLSVCPYVRLLQQTVSPPPGEDSFFVNEWVFVGGPLLVYCCRF